MLFKCCLHCMSVVRFSLSETTLIYSIQLCISSKVRFLNEEIIYAVTYTNLNV